MAEHFCSTIEVPMNASNHYEWKRAAGRALVSGTAASLLSTVVMSLAGKVERNAPAGPINGPNKASQPITKRLRNAAVTATVANVVDYRLTPRRLQPGFDAQLSRKSMLAIYAAFAVGLTVYDWSSRGRQSARQRE
jgi:hypothetical protein